MPPSPYYGADVLLQVGDELAVGWNPEGRYRTEAQRQLVAFTLDLANSLPSLTVCPLQITHLPQVSVSWSVNLG